MGPIEIIKDKLKKYPYVKFVETEDSITILPVDEDGFEIALYVGDEKSHEPYKVHFNGWHEDFDDSSQALECLAFGLSDECRLKEYSRGGNPYRWTIEHSQDGAWHEDSTTSLLSCLSGEKAK